MADRTWDEAEREASLAKHGVDFIDACLVFEDPFLIEDEDKRRGYGEVRIQATGFAQGKIMFVVYTPRGGPRRLISARLANRDERQRYEEKKKTHSGKPH
ncbi:MAG: BrnT family toxin [Rhodospirillales bacterium]